MKIAQRVIYTGRVQGVGFRYSVKQIAAGFEVTGWVRNLRDGTVELNASGLPAEIDAFLAAVVDSHLGGYIKDIRRETHDDFVSTDGGFEIRH